MIADKTGSISTWDQFMQLKTKARQRNTGFEIGGVAKSNVRQKTESMPLSTPALVPLSGNGYATRTRTYPTQSAVSAGKILGGRFDGWA